MIDAMTDKSVFLFLVDADPAQTQMLLQHLKKFTKFRISTFASGKECLEHLDENPEIIILDYDEAGNKETKGNLDVLREIKERKPETEVILLSAHDKAELALNSMKYGAFDYALKNENAFVRIEHIIYNILGKNRLK